MTLDDIEKSLSSIYLTINGAFHPGPEDMVPEGVGTLVLLGPKEPGFWAYFTASEEYQNGQPHPVDRWSERVISNISKALNAHAFFPFDGPPHQPFIRWAKASGRAHNSPVGLLVHDQAGMMISYRGALGFEAVFDLPEPPPSPCISCEKRPCISTCPVDAFASGSYDVPVCKSHLDDPKNTCMSKGCAVRRACPVSQAFGRVEEQSAFHMRAFK